MATNYRDLDWKDQLGLFQKDRNLGQTELSRALNQSNLYKAQGDTDAYNRAQTWMGQINTAMGNPTDRQGMQTQTQQNYYNNVNKAPELRQVRDPFSVSKESIESNPIYQAQKSLAQQEANTATNNAIAILTALGQGHSSYSTGRANQIQQNAASQFNAKTFPQIVEFMYKQYMDRGKEEEGVFKDNYTIGQDQIRNQGALTGYFDNLDQRDIENQRADKQANWNAYLDSVGMTQNLGDGPKADWSFLGGTGGPLTYGAQQDALQNDRAERQLIATLSNMTADNARANAAEARAAGNQQLGNLYDIWDRTGVAPAGISGVAPGTPLSGTKSKPADQIDAKSSSDNYNLLLEDLATDGVDKATAKRLLEANKSSLSDSDYRRLADYITENF